MKSFFLAILCCSLLSIADALALTEADFNNTTWSNGPSWTLYTGGSMSGPYNPVAWAFNESQQVLYVTFAGGDSGLYHSTNISTSGSTTTIDRLGAPARRTQALKGKPTKLGMDRDEAPPAVFMEGSKSVRHIPIGDNRGAGASIGQQIRQLKNGDKVQIIIE